MRRANLRDAHETQANSSSMRIGTPTRAHAVCACPQPDGTTESLSEGSASGTSMRSGGVKSGVSSTALVKRIVGRHINNLKEAI